jgi:hypothetical protein
VPVFAAIDDAPHQPPDAGGPGWRECWSLDWHDPATGSAAAYRVRAAADGAAEVRTWALTNGSVTGHKWTSRLDVDPDTGTLRASGLRLRTLEPLRSYALTTDSGTGHPHPVDLTYTGATDAFRFSMSGQRAEPGGAHYESFGTVTGTIRTGTGSHPPLAAQVVTVDGQGFYRHSWGVPNPGTQLVRSVHGMFDAALFFSVAEYRTPAGSAPLGYIFEGGEFHGVEKARFHAETDESGLPRTRDVLLATADRRDFRIVATLAPATGEGPQFAAFVLGKYRGSGLFERHQLG